MVLDEIIGFISIPGIFSGITTLIGFIAGIFVNRHFDRSKVKREKARVIDSILFYKFNDEIRNQLDSFEAGTYGTIKSRKLERKIVDGEKIVQILLEIGVFVEQKKQLRVLYNQDKIFNKYSEKINQKVVEYRNIFNDYFSQIDEIKLTLLPANFDKEFNTVFGRTPPPSKDSESIKFLITSLLDNPKACDGGSSWIYSIISEKFDLLQNLMFTFEPINSKYNEIKVQREKMINILSDLDEIIIELHSEWQNKLIT